MTAARTASTRAAASLFASLLVGCVTVPAARVAPSESPVHEQRVEETRRTADALVGDARSATARGDRVRATHLYESALKVWERFAGKQATLLPTYIMRWSRRTVAMRAALSPDRRTLAVSWEGNGIALFDTSTWQPIALFDLHRTPVTALVFSGSPERLWSVDAQGGVCRVDPANAKHACVGGADDQPDRDNSIALSPDGERVLFPCQGKVCFWDVAKDAPEPHAVRLPAACPNPRAWLDRERVMSQSDDGAVCIVELTGRARQVLPKGRTVAFSSRSPLVFEQSFDDWRHQFIHDILTLHVVSTIGDVPADLPVRGVRPEAISPNGAVVAATLDNHIATWSAADGRFLAARRVALSHDVTFLANGQLLVAEPAKLRFGVYSANTLEDRGGYRSPDPVVPGIAVSSDAKRMAVWSQDRVRVWSLEDGSVSPATFPSARRFPPTEVLTFLGGSRWLALENNDGLVVADVASGNEVFRRPYSSKRTVTAVGLDRASGKDALVVVSSDSPESGCHNCTGYVERFDFATGEPRPGAAGSVAHHQQAQLSEDARVLMTTGAEMLVWELPEAKLRLRTHVRRASSMLSPDGRQIAWADGRETIEGVHGHLHLIDTSTGVERVALTTVGVHHPGGWLADSSAVVVLENEAVAEPPGARMGIIDTQTARVLRESNAPMECGINMVSPDGRFAGGACDNNEQLIIGDLTRPHVWVRLHLEEDAESWLAEDPEGRIDYGGPRGAAMVACQVGPWVLPIELCEHRFRTPGLLAKGLFARR